MWLSWYRWQEKNVMAETLPNKIRFFLIYFCHGRDLVWTLDVEHKRAKQSRGAGSPSSKVHRKHAGLTFGEEQMGLGATRPQPTARSCCWQTEGETKKITEIFPFKY
jgi:hypothetical protein